MTATMPHDKTTANDVTVRELAFGLAAGVMLDAVVVRMLLLPALVSLFGKANWWMPGWAARVLRIRPEQGFEPVDQEPVPALMGDD